MRLTTAQRDMARQELSAIRARAEALAESFDPARTFTANDETTRIIVKAADVIASQASHALSVLRVTEP